MDIVPPIPDPLQDSQNQPKKKLIWCRPEETWEKACLFTSIPILFAGIVMGIIVWANFGKNEDWIMKLFYAGCVHCIVGFCCCLCPLREKWVVE